MLYNLYYLKEWETKEIFEWAMGEKKPIHKVLVSTDFK